MNENNIYNIAEHSEDAILHEDMTLQYNNVESLKLRCLEKVMQLNDSSVLVNVLRAINEYQYDEKELEWSPYTLEELQTRSDEAYEEFEAGGGREGEQFFAELNQYIMSR